MVRWIEKTFGVDAVPWVFFTATITLAVAGAVFTIAFGVAGFVAGLGVSIPAILVGGIGTLITGMTLEDKNYI